jgi:hypothetical protein
MTRRAANWIDVGRFGSQYDEQVDINATPMRYRHRRRQGMGGSWHDGPAPDRKREVLAK